MELTDQIRKPHFAIFPLSGGMGHFIPAAEFANRLCAWHGFSLTLILSKWMWTSQQPAFTQRLTSSGLDIQLTEIPEFAIGENEENMNVVIRLSKFTEKAKPHIGDVLQSLLNSSPPISAFVTDLFCTVLLDVTAKLNIPTYLFVPASASFVCLMIHLPKLVSDIEVSFKDADFEVEIPGLPLIPARDLPPVLHDRSDYAFYEFVRHSSRLKEATRIPINTFTELEEEAIKSLKEGKVQMPNIYPIGPLLLGSDMPDETDCLKWLDEQPASSVLFVSFESGAVLSNAQITDLALGLEASGHRFLWVLRGYKSGGFTLETDVSQLLPEGFENRTKDRGLVVVSWAP